MTLVKTPYKGTRDFFPPLMRARDYLFQKMREASEQFGYEPYDGPILEEVDLYRAKSGEELINEQIYSFMDRGEREVAIRPEMTPTVARMVAQVYREVPRPIRWYAIPNLMRYEKPQRGRLREFWQYNADIFGAPDSLAEIECLQLAVAIMNKLGANHNHFEILLNDRRFVDALFSQKMNLNPEQSKALYKILDKAKKVTAEKLTQMLSELKLSQSNNDLVLKYLQLSTIQHVCGFIGEQGLGEQLASFLDFLKRAEQTDLKNYIVYDPTIVRGLDYYTGVVFELYDKHPDNRRALAGGGAYANLLQIFNEEPLGGIGFGMGEVPVTDFLNTHKLMPDFSKPNLDLLISYLDLSAENASFRLAHELRSLNITTELMLGESKPKKALQQAERKGHKSLIMIGGNEVTSNEVEIKILATRQTQKFSLQDTKAIAAFIQGSARDN